MGYHEKVFGYCDSGCKVETLPKEYIEAMYRAKQKLINNDFQVNQRGQSEYVNLGKGQFCLDMWRNTNGNNQDLNVEVVENGIKLTTTQQRIVITQRVQDCKINKRYTVNLSINDKECEPLSWFLQDTTWQLKELYQNGNNIGRVSLQITSENNCYLEVYIDGQSNILNWVDLFEGDIAYPHVKKSYAEDLMECMQYVEVINCHVTCDSSSNALLQYHSKRIAHKRSEPTIEKMQEPSLDNVKNLKFYANTYGTLTITFNSNQGGMCRIRDLKLLISCE